MPTIPIMTIDCNGLLNAMFRGADSSWSGPQIVGLPAFVPGAEIVVRAIASGVFTALAVDQHSVLNALFFDETGGEAWVGPSLIGDPNLEPGAPVATATAEGTHFWALSVDRTGLLNIFSLDTSIGRVWTPTPPLGDADLLPGGHVRIVGDRTTALCALAIDRGGAIQAFSFQAGAEPSWSGPSRVTSAGLVAGAWIGA